MSELRDKVENIVNDCLREIKENSRRAGQVATGRTLGSLESDTFDFGDAIYSKIIGYAYLGALETGRGPARKAGTKQQQQEFLRNLIEWCRIRGVPSEAMNDQQVETFAKYLKWRINKFGTTLYRKGGRTDIITPAINRMQERLEKEVQEVMSDQLRRVNNNFFNKQL